MAVRRSPTETIEELPSIIGVVFAKVEQLFSIFHFPFIICHLTAFARKAPVRNDKWKIFQAFVSGVFPPMSFFSSPGVVNPCCVRTR